MHFLSLIVCRRCGGGFFSSDINLLSPSKMVMLESHRQISHYTSSFHGRLRRILEFGVFGFLRRRIAENMANQFIIKYLISKILKIRVCTYIKLGFREK